MRHLPRHSDFRIVYDAPFDDWLWKPEAGDAPPEITTTQSCKVYELQKGTGQYRIYGTGSTRFGQANIAAGRDALRSSTVIQATAGGVALGGVAVGGVAPGVYQTLNVRSTGIRELFKHASSGFFNASKAAANMAFSAGASDPSVSTFALNKAVTVHFYSQYGNADTDAKLLPVMELYMGVDLTRSVS